VRYRTRRAARGLDVSKKKQLALLALLLLVPVPSLGAWMAFYGAPGAVGQSVYFAGKAWLALFPLLWFLRFQRGWPSFSPLAREHRVLGLGLALVHGVILSGALYGLWLWKGSAWLDVEHLRETLTGAGVTTSTRYVVLCAFLSLFNSLIEEYAWRWFVTKQCTTLMGNGTAVVASALFFAAHHAIAFSAQFGLAVGLAAAGGVFVAGCLWSWCYLRFDSVWPGWISHVMVDVTGFAIGWQLLYA
jgi:membrane protease YdiL (CAAX protease family)